VAILARGRGGIRALVQSDVNMVNLAGHIDGSAVGPTFSFHRIQIAFQEGYRVC